MRARLAICTILLASSSLLAETLKPKMVEAWNNYVRQAEERMSREVQDPQKFLFTDFLPAGEATQARATMTGGEIYIHRVDAGSVKADGALIHAWMGGVWIPGATLKSLLQWVQDYDNHSKHFTEVERSKLLSHEGDTFKIYYRFRRKKVITVHYNTDHTVIYRIIDAKRAMSHSVATRIAELENAGASNEKEKPVGDDNGFMWRLNSYWRFQEAPGGVFLECESLSLSRGIPAGLAWMVKGFVESVPRESLENTLHSIRKGNTK